MKIRSDSIVSADGNGPIIVTHGASLPSGSQVSLVGSNINVNATGISTIGNLSATNINTSGVVTATKFVGDGSNLTDISSVSSSKAIALKFIIADPPLRA